MSESKIILTGNFGVGKSSLFKRIIQDKFEEKYLTTIGVKVGHIDVQGKNLLFWDIAGEVAQDKIPPTYFLNTEHILYVIDLSRPSTFHVVAPDLQFLQQRYPNCQLQVIGNKIDLLADKQLLDERISLLPCPCQVLSSAKTGEGIEELLNTLTK